WLFGLTTESIDKQTTELNANISPATDDKIKISKLKYQTFVKSVANLKPDISILPPTEGTARQHSYRTYHQVQQWLGNNLPPQDWGWTMKGDVLVPTQTEDPPAPEVLLKTVFCRCTKDCSSGKCSCRKAMLVCNTACSHCQGSCLYGVPLFDENENEDDISPPASPLPSPISSQLTFWDEDEAIAGPSNPKRPRVT
ncbi:hypothetical protein WDU94_015639, partial [Cyamophila willieti]